MDEQDGRKKNNPHPAVREAGAAAARRGEAVYLCPYSHPAMRNSWLRGYSGAQQLTLEFDSEGGDE